MPLGFTSHYPRHGSLQMSVQYCKDISFIIHDEIPDIAASLHVWCQCQRVPLYCGRKQQRRLYSIHCFCWTPTPVHSRFVPQASDHHTFGSDSQQHRLGMIDTTRSFQTTLESVSSFGSIWMIVNHVHSMYQKARGRFFRVGKWMSASQKM